MDPTLLQGVALKAASARQVSQVLEDLVLGIEAQPGVALARIWLRRPGGPCDACPLAGECDDRRECLHLVASAGASRGDPSIRWDETDGRFARFPLGVRKVGRVAAEDRPLRLCVVRDGGDWFADPAWARAEGIAGFSGHPLTFRDEVLGVLAVFSRQKVTDDCMDWLQTFANQAAVALANARAFEEVQRLRAALEAERDYLREEVSVARQLGGIVGESPSIQRVLQQIAMVGPSDMSVLVLGESGTGKELLATALHEASERRQGPMVRVNCASIPAELFESEFFGHVRGAFTGATADRAGRFQVADGGTLFLDEVGEIPLPLQGKLLRALQEGQFSPVGSDRVLSSDVRVVAATNRDLSVEVAEGRFRQDLYYRLAVFPLEVPPLRDRREDIPALAAHFLRAVASRRAAPGPVLRRRDVEALSAYDWPGNVRELQNVIERAVILGSADRLAIELGLGGQVRPARAKRSSAAGHASGVGAPADQEATSVRTEAERLEDLAADIRQALRLSGGKLSGPDGAAALLGLAPTTLASRMKALGLRRNG